MRPFNMSDEEKDKLLKQHKDAVKEANHQREILKGGVVVPKKENKEKD